MDHTILVDIDVKLGLEIVNGTEALGMSFTVALWATFLDYFDPRLVLAAPWLDQHSPRTSYGEFGEVLRKTNLSPLRTPPLLIRRLSDPFIRELRETYAGISNLEGLRLGGQSFGGRYLEDGYVYRIV